MWKPAPENTLESLRHAIQMHDGIEFDLRLTKDKEVVIHHDGNVSVPKEKLGSGDAWVEHRTLSAVSYTHLTLPTILLV